ncbi:ULK protein kinase [Salpingoeca rosetta]|uniref:ULK protein kinase n=1 Tax=Salpingoeca rosetta (strain ATCC 50818 / BSB-021) TaxID=946362 RepID=F2U060_SALR5|nr:ULK protein kinase [Salpingoeca rosetta]EGD80788.1 ULK protein kinase [Salpingoeca rosetta]|eukprot:XP_004997349.1 ULK protein kinase [Salpingoeca rosetta]
MEEYILYHDIGRGHTTSAFKGRKSNTLEYLALLQVENKYSGLAAVRYAAAQAVRSEHVCRVDLHCDTGPEVWLVSELCSAISLRSVVNGDGYLMGSHLMKVLTEILLAVAHCHVSGVVVGDVRLEKFLVQDGHIKLCSLGRAMAMHRMDPVPTTASPSGVTQVTMPTINKEQVKGLIADMDRIHCQQYLAPEVHTRHAVTPLSDLWATGVALLELMIGRAVPPPEAGAELHVDNLRDVAREIGHPPDVVALVLNLLQRRPEQRWCWRDVIASPLLHDDNRFALIEEELLAVDEQYAPRPPMPARTRVDAHGGEGKGGPRLSASVASRVSASGRSSRSASSRSSSSTIVGDGEHHEGEFDEDDEAQPEHQRTGVSGHEHDGGGGGGGGGRSGRDDDARSSVAAVFKGEHDTLMTTRQLNPATSLVLSKASLARRSMQRPATGADAAAAAVHTPAAAGDRKPHTAAAATHASSAGEHTASAELPPRARTAQAWLDADVEPHPPANPWAGSSRTQAGRQRAHAALRRAHELLEKHGVDDSSTRPTHGGGDSDGSSGGEEGEEEGEEEEAVGVSPATSGRNGEGIASVSASAAATSTPLQQRRKRGTVTIDADYDGGQQEGVDPLVVDAAQTPASSIRHHPAANMRREVGRLSPRPPVLAGSTASSQSTVAGRGGRGDEDETSGEADSLGGGQPESRGEEAASSTKATAATTPSSARKQRSSSQTPKKKQQQQQPLPLPGFYRVAPFRLELLDADTLQNTAEECTPARLRELVHEFSDKESLSSPPPQQPQKPGVIWELLESGRLPMVDELILIDSDLAINPILNTKNKSPKYDQSAIGGFHHDPDTIADMSDEETTRFTQRVMSTLQLTPASRARTRSAARQQRAASGTARPEKRTRLHILAYLLHICQDERVCNLFANSPVLPALCASFRTAPDFCRERMAVLVGTIIRNTTVMHEDVDMSLMLHNLADALREFFRTASLKRLLLSAMGEALFYAVTQRLAATSDLPPTWDIPAVSMKMVFKCLSKDEEKSVQLAAARTLENMASVDGAHQQTLRRQDSVDVMAKAYLLLAGLQRVRPQTLEQSCTPSALGIRPHSPLEAVLSDIDQTHTSHTIKEQWPQESVEYLQQCSAVFVGEVREWIPEYIGRLHTLLSLVSRRNHPSSAQAKELRELFDLYKLAVTYLHSTVILRALPSSALYIDCLRVLRCVAFTMDGTTSLDEVAEDAGQVLFTETAVALLQLTQHADTQELLEAWTEMIHGVGSYRAVQNEEMKQTVLHVYTAASQHVHANANWSHTREVMRTASADLQDLLALVTQVLESESASSVPCFHVLCDLWDAFPDTMASFCATMPEMVEESMSSYQPLVDVMPSADLASDQMCNTEHDLDSAFVMRHAAYVISCIPHLADGPLALRYLAKQRLVSKAVATLIASILALSKRDTRVAEEADVAIFSLRVSMCSLLLLLQYVLQRSDECAGLLPLFSPISALLHRLLNAVPKAMLPMLRPIQAFIRVFAATVPDAEARAAMLQQVGG